MIAFLPEDAPETKDEKAQRRAKSGCGTDKGADKRGCGPCGPNNNGQRQETAGENNSHPFFGGRGGGGWRGRGGGCGKGGGFGPGMGRGFMGMMKGFMEKLGGPEKMHEMKQEWMKTMKEGTEEEKAGQWKKMGEHMEKLGEHMKDFKPEEGEDWNTNFKCGNMFGGDKDGNTWNQLRAKIVSKPEGVLEACPGTSLIEEIEVLNDTFWPWKQGCSLTLSEDQSMEDLPIEIINVPIEQEVKGKTSMKICVPLTIAPHIVADDDKVYTIILTFRGPKGQAFGEPIPIKIKVTLPKQQFDELEIYKLAIKLHEMNLGSFEECAKAVKDNGCDETASTKALQRKD